MNRQMQAADHSFDWYVEDTFSACEHPLDAWVAATADQYQPEASHVDNERLLRKRSEPEHHRRERRQDSHPGAITSGPVVSTTSVRS